jgi:hypothetical protein
VILAVTTAPVTDLAALPAFVQSRFGVSGALPPGASALQFTLSAVPGPSDTFELSCPGGSVPAAWSADAASAASFVLDTPSDGTGPSTFGVLLIGPASQTGYVLCRPYAASRSTPLKAGAKAPFTVPTLVKKGRPTPKTVRFVRVSASGLQPGVDAVVRPGCPTGTSVVAVSGARLVGGVVLAQRKTLTAACA